MKVSAFLVVFWVAVAFSPVHAADSNAACPSINDDKFRIRPWVIETTSLDIKDVLQKKYFPPPVDSARTFSLHGDDIPKSMGGGGLTPEMLLTVLEDRFRAEFRFWIREEVLSDLCSGEHRRYFPNTCDYYKENKSKSVSDAVFADALRDDFRGLPACYVYSKAPDQSGSDLGYYLSRLVMAVNEQKDPKLLLAGLAENAEIKRGCKKLGDRYCPIYLTGALAQAIAADSEADKDTQKNGQQRLEPVLWRLLYKLDRDGKCTAEFGINCADYVKDIDSLKKKMGSLKALIEDLRALSSLYVDFKNKLKSDVATTPDERRIWQNAVLKATVEAFLDIGDVYREFAEGLPLNDDANKLAVQEAERAVNDASKALASAKQLLKELAQAQALTTDQRDDMASVSQKKTTEVLEELDKILARDSELIPVAPNNLGTEEAKLLRLLGQDVPSSLAEIEKEFEAAVREAERNNSILATALEDLLAEYKNVVGAAKRNNSKLATALEDLLAEYKNVVRAAERNNSKLATALKNLLADYKKAVRAAERNNSKLATALKNLLNAYNTAVENANNPRKTIAESLKDFSAKYKTQIEGMRVASGGLPQRLTKISTHFDVSIVHASGAFASGDVVLRSGIVALREQNLRASTRAMRDALVASNKGLDREIELALKTRLGNADLHLSRGSGGDPGAKFRTGLMRTYYQLLSVMQVSTTVESGDYTGALKSVKHVMRCASGLKSDRKDKVCDAWAGMVLDPNGVQEVERILGRIDFVVAASQVKSSKDAKEFLDSYGTPTGFWLEKRNRDNVWSIGALAGVAVGRERLSASGVDSSSLYMGGFLPVGLDFSWRSDTDWFKTRGFFISVFDLGPMLSTRFDNDPNVQNNANVGFGQLVSPGLYLRWGIKRTPWVVGFGASTTPALRRMTVNGGTMDGNSTRWLAFIAMDLPLLGF